MNTEQSKETENNENEKAQENVKSEQAQNTQTEAPQAEAKTEENEKKESVPEEKTPEQVIEEQEKEIASLKDQYLRKCADFDNYRKRMIREKQEAFDYANANLLTDLLSILDDLDRALNASSDAKEVDNAKALIQGVEMIQKQLKNMLESKYNLVAFGEKGDEFDHDKHEAIASNPANVEKPTCAEVYLKGYMLKDRILRPAKVMVHMPDGSDTKK